MERCEGGKAHLLLHEGDALLGLLVEQGDALLEARLVCFPAFQQRRLLVGTGRRLACSSASW